jgi:hypothetical protein
MIKRISLLFILLSAWGGTMLLAQTITVSAAIDSTQIWIGQQTKLSFELTQQPNQIVQSPLFSDVIIKGLELVEPMKSDTTTSPDGLLVIKQSYTITAFDDTLFLIPPFPFVIEEDTVWSKPVSLKVIQPFVIDTTKSQIADIKDVFKPKFSLMYFLKKLYPWFIGALLLGIILFLLMKYLRKKPGILTQQAATKLPPYEMAVIKLEKIKKEKLWQQNRHKEYHSEITDVLREYIEDSLQVPAMEMTSDEILTQLNYLRLEDKVTYNALHQILQLADLVKFAKWNAAPDEHELSLTNAFYFVDHTKTEEEKKEDDIS